MKSSLLYSYQIEYGDGYRTFMESVEQSQLAERYGFDTVLVSEHHLVENGYFPAPAVTNGALAMCTKKLRIGPGILLLPLYNPLHVAEHGTILEPNGNPRRRTMRDLTTVELQTVSGAFMPPAPKGPTSILGVKLSRADRRLLAIIIESLSRPRK